MGDPGGIGPAWEAIWKACPGRRGGLGAAVSLWRPSGAVDAEHFSLELLFSNAFS
jgi:hypothetical protein